MKNNKKSGISKMAVGAGIAALGAGAYYLFGPKAKMHQKKAKVLMAKIEREVAKEVKKAKKISVPVYDKIVDVVSQNYAKQYKLHEKDVKAFVRKLKNEWQRASKVAKKPVRTPKKKGK